MTDKFKGTGVFSAIEFQREPSEPSSSLPPAENDDKKKVQVESKKKEADKKLPTK